MIRFNEHRSKRMFFFILPSVFLETQLDQGNIFMQLFWQKEREKHDLQEKKSNLLKSYLKNIHEEKHGRKKQKLNT